jgi:hypothetical protein
MSSIQSVQGGSSAALAAVAAAQKQVAQKAPSLPQESTARESQESPAVIRAKPEATPAGSANQGKGVNLLA